MIRRNCCFGISLITALLVIIGVIISGNDVLAKVSVNLPQTPGLYVADYIDWDDDKIMTDTDDNGNTFLINHDSKVIPWRDQNNSDYLTKGMEADDPEEYWGQGFENGQEVWFDYIANGKVTHVNAEDIIITNLDGTDCGNDLLIEADNRDERVCRFTMNVSYKKVIITYKNDDDLANCKFVAEFALRTGFYTSDETELDTLIMDEPVVLRGKSKDIYFHMTDVWEEDGFELFEKDPVSIRYWDRAQNKEVELTGDKVNDYITLTKISGENEKHHVIYKLTVNGIDSVDDGYNITVNFNRFNINNPNDKNKEDRQKFVKVRDTDILYAAGPEFLTVNGDQYTYSENAEYRKNGYFSAGSLYRPIYIDLKYCDDNGDMQPVEDLTKLSFYLSRWNEEEEKAILTKVGSDVIKAEKPYVDSDIIMVSYVGDTTKDDNKWNEFIVAYGDEVPAGTDMDSAIELSFVSSDFNELGTYKSNEINENSFTNEFVTDGYSNLVLYVSGFVNPEFVMGKKIESIENVKAELFDDEGNDISDKIILDDNAGLFSNNGDLACRVQITIPKGIITSSAILKIKGTLKGKRFKSPDDLTEIDYSEEYNTNAYLFLFKNPNVLYAAHPEYLSVKGKQYTYTDNSEYIDHGYYAANSLFKPIYMQFKYSDENSVLHPVNDPSKLTFYRTRWNDELGKDEITKVGYDQIKVEKPYVDSDIIKISYVGDTTKDDNRWNEFVVGYDNINPAGGSMDKAIELAFVTSDFDEVGSYNSTEINESTYAKEFETDGTADINIYAASLDLKEATPWNYVESAKISSVILTDEKGKDLSSKVKFNSVTLSSNEKPAIVYSEMVTIPKGTLTSSAKLRINVTANCNHWSNPEANERVVTPENYSLDVYILFTPHTHKAGKEWKKDNVNHWHECVAGDGTIYDKAAHSWDNGVITAQPTTDKEGVKTYTCSVCNATKTEKIDKLPVQSTDTQKITEVPQIVPVKEGDTKVDDKGASYTVTETSETGKTEVEYSAPDKTDSKVTIPETVDINGKIATVTSVADNAFSGNKTVTEIVLPSSIEVIGNNSFKNCSKLKNITLTNKVETIGTGAFSGCTSLKKIIISKNVRVIGKNAFSGAKKLKTITIKGNKIKTIGKNAFKNVPKTTTITIPKKAKKSYTKMLKKAGFKGKIKVK